MTHRKTDMESVNIQLRGISRLAEELDGELLINVIKHFNCIQDENKMNKRIFNRLSYVYYKRFGFAIELK